jgi:hypothetical protein
MFRGKNMIYKHSTLKLKAIQSGLNILAPNEIPDLILWFDARELAFAIGASVTSGASNSVNTG